MLKKHLILNFCWLVALLTTIMLSYARVKQSYEAGYYDGAYVGASYFMIHRDYPTRVFLERAVAQPIEETSRFMIEEAEKRMTVQRKSSVAK